MTHASSTQDIPAHDDVPRHVAIIMDGNGRWARSRLLPRIAGHRRGLQAGRPTIENLADPGIEFPTPFAFHSHNWPRPAGGQARPPQLFQPPPTSGGGRNPKNHVARKG